MDYKTHLCGGLGAAYVASYCLTLDPQQTLFIYSAALIGSVLPDIDHPKAHFSKYTQLTSNFLYNTCGHRTLTHSLLFTLIAFTLGSYFGLYAGLGLALGIVSHILLDLLSPHGVAFLYPFYKQRIKIM